MYAGEPTQLYDCTEQAFKNNQAKFSKQLAIETNIKPFYSWYYSTKFLSAFYTEMTGQVDNCYERLLDFFVNAKLEGIANDKDTERIGYELDLLHNQTSFFGDLGDAINSIIKYAPALMLVVGIGYFINAVKK